MRNELMQALKRYPVFTVRDIAHALRKSREYAYLVAYRAKKAGTIQEIEKGKYALEDDPLIVASWIVWPSYISVWAALNYHKLTEQLPFTIHVVTTKKRKKRVLSFGGAKIEFLRIKKPAFNGFRRAIYHGKEIFVAEKEKAIIDGIAARKISMDEAEHLLKSNGKKINRRRLLSYAKAVNGLVKKLAVVLHDKKR